MRFAIKLGRSFAGTTPLPSRLIEKAVEETGDFGLGPFGANDFDEMQITRRIEKVNAEEMLLEIVGTAFGEQVNRNATGV